MQSKNVDFRERPFGEETMRGVEERRECGELTPGPGYFWVCTIGGMLSAGTTHVAITPLDVLKVNMQVCLCDYVCLVS